MTMAMGYLQEQEGMGRNAARQQKRRGRMYRLAETYDRWLVRWWTTKDMPGMEPQADHAKAQLELARKRMDRAGRGR